MPANRKSESQGAIPKPADFGATATQRGHGRMKLGKLEGGTCLRYKELSRFRDPALPSHSACRPQPREG
jgi:hypothetical protein